MSTAMLGALTLNIHRKSGAEPVDYSSFVPFPAATKGRLIGLDSKTIVQLLKIVPSGQLASLIEPMKNELMAEYYWSGEDWLYEVD
jgi:hypothetical protein